MQHSVSQKSQKQAATMRIIRWFGPLIRRRKVASNTEPAMRSIPKNFNLQREAASAIICNQILDFN